jgi:hypothetical protein
MSDARTRSPRCPSHSLGEALKRAQQIYDKNHRHPVAPDVAAKAMGLKNADSGTAKTAIASLIYYGLLNRGGDSKLSVSAEVEKYQFTPDPLHKARYLQEWFSKPKVFSELVARYGEKIPGDDAIKYELISNGFKPAAADEATQIFRESLEFLKLNGASLQQGISHEENEVSESSHDEISDTSGLSANTGRNGSGGIQASVAVPAGFKAITIFLPKGREAILHVPRPFYDKDRETIIRQLTALLTDDEE